jgi:hypothetical protein
MRTTIAFCSLALIACGGGDAETTDAGRQLDAPSVLFDAPRENVDAGPCTPGTASAPDEVATSFGVFRGETSGSTHVFRGIPYAAPPIGPLRFREPAPPLCSSSVRDATEFGPVCPQLADGTPIGDEDCLSLNVWTPTSRGSEPLPVLFFIHGGGNNQGSGSEAIMGMPI